MIFALGYKLSEVAIKDVGKSFAAGGMRILFGVILGVLSVRLLHLEGVEASVVILLAAMPPAVFNFVLADRYNQDSETVASIILAGTLISAVTTPVIIAFLSTRPERLFAAHAVNAHYRDFEEVCLCVVYKAAAAVHVRISLLLRQGHDFDDPVVLALFIQARRRAPPLIDHVELDGPPCT
ncbi:MAG: AEC family transporter [Thermodesulfobacteriota bacterium]